MIPKHETLKFYYLSSSKLPSLANRKMASVVQAIPLKCYEARGTEICYLSDGDDDEENLEYEKCYVSDEDCDEDGVELLSALSPKAQGELAELVRKDGKFESSEHPDVKKAPANVEHGAEEAEKAEDEDEEDEPTETLGELKKKMLDEREHIESHRGAGDTESAIRIIEETCDDSTTPSREGWQSYKRRDNLPVDAVPVDTAIDILKCINIYYKIRNGGSCKTMTADAIMAAGAELVRLMREITDMGGRSEAYYDGASWPEYLIFSNGDPIWMVADILTAVRWIMSNEPANWTVTKTGSDEKPQEEDATTLSEECSPDELDHDLSAEAMESPEEGDMTKNISGDALLQCDSNDELSEIDEDGEDDEDDACEEDEEEKSCIRVESVIEDLDENPVASPQAQQLLLSNQNQVYEL
jgi:hypothetical protein